MNRTRKIVLLINPNRQYTQSIVRGIVKYSRLQGNWIFYRYVDYREPKGKDRLLPLLKKWKPDGIIMREPQHIEEIIAMGVPTISCPYTRSKFPNISNIMTDHDEIGKTGAKYLLEKGFKNFAYCGFDDWWWSKVRGEYFSKTLAEAGYSTNFYKQPHAKSNRTWDKEPAIMSKWLLSLPKPIGIMTCNDDRGEMVIEACKNAKLQIPDEIAVVGVDNDSLICDLCHPPLSSVALNTEKAGYEASALLDKMIDNKKCSDLEIHVQPTHVEERQSTDILAIDDPDIIEAVRFIRRNSRRVIQVNDIVNSVSLSRRILEKRFRKIVGHSIHDEIRRVRVDHIIRMLAETEMSIFEISQAFGFQEISHLTRFFKREKGISPHFYRKQYLRK